MNVKKWLIASVVAFIAFAVMEWIVHGSILADAYKAKPELWATEATMKANAWALYVGQLIYAGMFALIYTKGYEGKPGLGEGFRYGLYMAFFTAVPRFLVNYAVMPYTANIAVTWLISGIIESVILGLIVGLIYRKPQPAAA